MNGGAVSANKVPEGLPCGQFVYCAEGAQNIVYADINVVHLFGCKSYEEFLAYVGNSFRNMVHPDDLKEADHKINAQTIESGHRHDYLRYRILTKQGVVRYVEDFGHFVRDEKGNAYYYVFIVEIRQEEYYNEYYNSFAESQIDAMNWKVDHLTGLKSIPAFQEELNASMISCTEECCTVSVFDILGLQEINHSRGRTEGDKHIRSLVQTVLDYMPKDSAVYRGYDAEIVVICRGRTEQEVLPKIIETVKACQNTVFFGVASSAGAHVSISRSEISFPSPTRRFCDTVFSERTAGSSP